jgi:hypothetical protein
MKKKGIARKHVERSGGLKAERRGTHPLFFVSVAAKELSEVVSLLFATLAWRAVVLQLKELWGRTVGEKATAWNGKILREQEGYLAGEDGIRDTQKRITESSPIVNVYFGYHSNGFVRR